MTLTNNVNNLRLRTGYRSQVLNDFVLFPSNRSDFFYNVLLTEDIRKLSNLTLLLAKERF